MISLSSDIPHSSTCTNVSSIRLLRQSSSRRMLILSVFALLYAAVLPNLLMTMGLPLERALEQAARLAENKSIVEDLAFEAQALEEAVVALEDATEEIVSGNVTGGEENGTIVIKNATELERPMPSPYLPDALPLFLFLAVGSLQALFWLMRRWFVWWQVYTEFEAVETAKWAGARVEEIVGTAEGKFFVHVAPLPHRGAEALCVLGKNVVTGDLEFSFQRQIYVWIRPPPVELNESQWLTNSLNAHERVYQTTFESINQELSEVDANDETDVDRLLSDTSAKQANAEATERGFVRLVLAKANSPISFYLNSRGLQTEADVEYALSRFGQNTLAVPQPPFAELLKEQLLKPLSVFQLFSAMLWAVDEYIQYTLFTLISIIMMESTTAFQRHRTMLQLKGLSPKSYTVFARRQGQWVILPTEMLLPGDLISLRTGTAVDGNGQPIPAQIVDTIVPCDVLLVGGTAIVNEATLTGESIPQMKDAIAETGDDRLLDIEGRDRVHTLFSGTSLVTHSPAVNVTTTAAQQVPEWMRTPDGGCACIVLRTGFGSSQGELMQMIEFSAQAVSADSKETGIALLILLVFALMSATYVFRKGMEKGDRTTHELLLKCIIIVTSVVPRQLPVQMALAVNHALMALLSLGIFCTEPFRVPEAGKVTHALFDKTGTLTADELTPVGVSSNDGIPGRLVDMRKANPEATLVLAACHSLVKIPNQANQLAGDPIEVAAVRGVRWGFDSDKSLAFPGDASSLEQSRAKNMERLALARNTQGTTPAVISNMEAEISNLTKAIDAIKTERKDSKYLGAKIVRRFHFEAALQRMSVVASVKINNHGRTDDFDEETTVEASYYSLCKGSPEALKKLCVDLPDWYDACYQNLAERGMRVLALALRKLDDSKETTKSKKPSKATLMGVDHQDWTRAQVESGLTFVGFVAFEAKIRGDSENVIRSLTSSNIRVAMLTGDAPLTALHVARVCGFFEGKKETLMLSASGETWRSALMANRTEKDIVEITCDVTSLDCGIEALVREGYDLIATEEGLEHLSKKSKGKVWSGVSFISVFARMSPRGKARVIRSIQKLGADVKINPRFVLMCGDGGNDVGALKQADVGLALLSGYGSANTNATSTTTTEAESKDLANDVLTAPGASTKDAEAVLNETMENQKKRAAHYGKIKAQEMDIKRKQAASMQKQWIEEEVAKLPEADRGLWSQLGVMKTVAKRMQMELALESQRLDKKYGLASVASDDASSKESKDPMAALEQETGMPVVRPGDASVAAPFTSRVPSVRSVVHLIRQGRCTLLAALQQQQIMMLECTITAYTYAMISLEGSRSSERQMMVSGWLIMGASLSFSYSTPLDRMSAVRPLRSLFHPAVFISIVGQAFIHLYSMSIAVKMATDAMGPEKLAEVVAFNKRVREGLAVDESATEEDPLKMFTQLWQKPFMPNLMNTTVFLVETAQIMAVLFVNYKGRPFMKGLLDNHALFLSLFMCIGGIAFASWEVVPQLNAALHFHQFPNDEYRWTVMFQIFLVVCGTFVWDRFVTWLFAPEVFYAMWDETRKTTWMDLFPIFASLFKVVGGFLVLATGNPVIWAAAWYARRKWNEYKELEDAKRLGLVKPQESSIENRKS